MANTLVSVYQCGNLAYIFISRIFLNRLLVLEAYSTSILPRHLFCVAVNSISRLPELAKFVPYLMCSTLVDYCS